MRCCTLRARYSELKMRADNDLAEFESLTMSRVESWFRNPIFLLALAAGLIAFVVQSGELGSADTMHRLQSTHAFWTSEPPVFPSEYPEFGVHGRNGTIQSWYGIGQSLLMLPSDILGTYIEKLHVFDRYGETDPTVRDIVVTYLTQMFVTVLTALVCFKLLRQFAFSVNQSVAGVLAFLLATTHLHYTQNMMENNYICLLTLAGFAFHYEWLQTGSRRALLIGTGAFGLNLLTRLTTGMDLLAGVLFVLLVLWFEGVRGRALWERLPHVCAGCNPGVLLLRVPRQAVSVLPIRIVHEHLREPGGEGSDCTRSEPAVELSVDGAVARGILRCTVCAGEVDLPV